ALVELKRGDHERYRQACGHMLERFGHSTSADAAYWTTRTCVLAPYALVDWAKPLKLTDDRHAISPNDCEGVDMISFLLYRTGRIEEAAQRMTEAGVAFKETGKMRTTIIYNWLFQAMVQHRLGHTSEAADWLEKAVREIDERSPEGTRDSRTNPWNRRLTLDLLRREAGRLLGKLTSEP